MFGCYLGGEGGEPASATDLVSPLRVGSRDCLGGLLPGITSTPDLILVLFYLPGRGWGAVVEGMVVR